MLTTRLSVAVIMALGAASAQPAEWPGLRVAGRIGGPTLAVAASDEIVVAGAGYRLAVYDASDPAGLREIGSSPPFSDFVRGIAVEGARAYVAAGSSGLHAVDLTDPAHPTLEGTWDSPGSAEAVSVEGTVAYLADGPLGVQVLDWAAPQNPTLLGSAVDEQMALDVVVSGTTIAVAAGGAGLLFVDVTDPRAPVELSVVDTPGFARAVAVSGTTLVLADQWEGLGVIDASQVRSPREIGRVETESWAFDVAVEGATAFVATGSAGLATVDLTNPAAPRIAGSLAVAGDALGIAKSAGGGAFVALGRAGLAAIDVTDPAAPRLLEVAASLSDGSGVAAWSSWVFVAAGGGLTVVDAADPTRPSEAAAFSAGSDEFGTYVATSSGYAYLGSNGHLVTLDVGDPTRPIETSRVDLGPAAFRGMAIGGGLLLAATEFDLTVFDITQRGAPVVRSKVPAWGGPNPGLTVGVALDGRYAYVADSHGGMAIVDLVNPASPVVVARYGAHPLIGVDAIAAANGYAYVPKCGRLEVVDVSDPAAPRLAASLSLPGCPYRATLADKTLYLAAGSEGVLEVDVSNPLQPVIRSRTVLPGFASEVAVTDSSIAVSVLRIGLFLLEKRGAGGAAPVEGTSRLQRRRRGREAAIAPEHLRIGPARPASGSALPGIRPTAGREIVVRAVGDSGAETFRQALATALEGDVITFDPAVFPPASPVPIRPLTPLGCVQRFVTVDASNAGVVIDGSLQPGDQLRNGLHLCSQGAVIRGLRIINFPGSGIAVSGTDNTIGGDPAQGTGPSGEGNLLSGNRDSGIDLGETARRNRIVGNAVGPPPGAGTTLRFQQKSGVFFARSSGNVLGGISPADRNVISGNDVDIRFIVAGHTTVAGNYIGTDSTGTRVAPTFSAASSEIGVTMEGGSHDNLIAGNVIASGQAVVIADSGSSFNRIVGNRIGVGPDEQPIAGLTASLGTGLTVHEPYNLVADNVIGGLRAEAVQVSAPADVWIVGNRIGTGSGGALTISNAGAGVLLRGARRAFLGGVAFGERNVISGNGGPGIELRGPGNEQNFLVGNVVGTGEFGWPAGNAQEGIRVSISSANFIQRNTVAGNRIGILSSEGSRNRIRRNSIFANALDGIEDVSDQAPPPPVLSGVDPDQVKGSACAGCLVEIFSDRDDEGRWFEGEAVAAGDGTFTMRKRGGVLRGPRISATATDVSGATSAFSATVASSPLLPPRRRAVRR